MPGRRNSKHDPNISYWKPVALHWSIIIQKLYKVRSCFCLEKYMQTSAQILILPVGNNNLTEII